MCNIPSLYPRSRVVPRAVKCMAPLLSDIANCTVAVHAVTRLVNYDLQDMVDTYCEDGRLIGEADFITTLPLPHVITTHHHITS